MTLPRSVQAGLYQHTQHTHDPTRASTRRKIRTIHPEATRADLRALRSPIQAAHTPTPLGRPRLSWTPL